MERVNHRQVGATIPAPVIERLETIAWANRWSLSKTIAVAAEYYVQQIEKTLARVSGEGGERN